MVNCGKIQGQFVILVLKTEIRKWSQIWCLDFNCWKPITVQCRKDSGHDRKKNPLDFCVLFQLYASLWCKNDNQTSLHWHMILKNSTTLQIFTARLRSYTRAEFFPIYEFFYKLIRFLLNSSIVKSDIEIGKFSYQDMECPRQTQHKAKSRSN